MITIKDIEKVDIDISNKIGRLYEKSASFADFYEDYKSQAIIKFIHSCKYVSEVYYDELCDLSHEVSAVNQRLEKEAVSSAMDGHYSGIVSPIDVIQEGGLNFAMGSVVKYACRCNKKGQKDKDLAKIIDYALYEIHNDNSIKDSALAKVEEVLKKHGIVAE